VQARIYPRIAPELANRLAQHAAAGGFTETAVVEAAIEQYLDRTSDRALVLARLDRNGRAYARMQRDQAFLSEAFAVFVKMWFAHTPSVPEDSRAAARALAEARYGKWLEHVVEQFSGGHRFVDDLPEEPIGDGHELVTGASEPPEKA
jgi:hypothetical protein